MARTVSNWLPAVLAVSTPVAGGVNRNQTVLPAGAQSGMGSPDSTVAAVVSPLIVSDPPMELTGAPAKLSVACSVTVLLAVGLVDGVGVGVSDTLTVGVAVAVGVPDTSGVGVAVDVLSAVAVAVGVGVGVAVPVGVGEQATTVGVCDGVEVAVSVAVGVLWGSALGVADAVSVGLGDGVEVAELVTVVVGVTSAQSPGAANALSSLTFGRGNTRLMPITSASA